MELDDGVVEQRSGVVPGPQLDSLQLDPPARGELLGASRDYAADDLVAPCRDLSQGGLDDRRVVLAVDYNEISNGRAPSPKWLEPPSEGKPKANQSNRERGRDVRKTQ